MQRYYNAVCLAAGTGGSTFVAEQIKKATTI